MSTTSVGDEGLKARQMRNRVLGLWLPMGLLCVLGIGLLKSNTELALWAMAASALWGMAASVALTLFEGLSTWGTGWLGHGPDIRDKGVFSYYLNKSYVALAAAFYAAMFVGGLSAFHLLGEPIDRAFGLAAAQFAAAAFFLELFSWRLVRKFGAWPQMQAAVAHLLPGSVFGFLASSVVFLTAKQWHPAVPFQFQSLVGIGTVCFYAFIFLGSHRYLTRVRQQVLAADQRAAEADTGRSLAEAKLAVLQAQIEPHFLYNTLGTVQYLIRGEPDAAEYMLAQLIRYLRLSMPSMRRFTSTLEREFELTDAYLQIARMRTGGRLTVDLDLQQDMADIEFPPLVLQTLAENALKHGVEQKPGPVRIQIGARRDGDFVQVSVRDDGIGFGAAPTQGGGTGLRNTRERLQGIYGDTAKLVVEGQPEGGVLATVTIPVSRKESTTT